MKFAMAKNTGNGYRKGSVKDRTQACNPKTNLWVKRDAETGQFMDQKPGGGAVQRCRQRER